MSVSWFASLDFPLSSLQSLSLRVHCPLLGLKLWESLLELIDSIKSRRRRKDSNPIIGHLKERRLIEILCLWVKEEEDGRWILSPALLVFGEKTCHSVCRLPDQVRTLFSGFVKHEIYSNVTIGSLRAKCRFPYPLPTREQDGTVGVSSQREDWRIRRFQGKAAGRVIVRQTQYWERVCLKQFAWWEPTGLNQSLTPNLLGESGKRKKRRRKNKIWRRGFERRGTFSSVRVFFLEYIW